MVPGGKKESTYSAQEGTQIMSTDISAAITDATIRPFHVAISEAAVADLRRRVAAWRAPERAPVDDQSQGVQLATVHGLAHYWTTDYDWRRCARRPGGPRDPSGRDGRRHLCRAAAWPCRAVGVPPCSPLWPTGTPPRSTSTAAAWSSRAWSTSSASPRRYPRRSRKPSQLIPPADCRAEQLTVAPITLIGPAIGSCSRCRTKRPARWRPRLRTQEGNRHARHCGDPVAAEEPCAPR